MKKSMILLSLVLMAAVLATGCEKKDEKVQPQQTETYVEKNTITVVHHDTENVDFRIAVIGNEMKSGLEHLMEDAKKGEAANRYRFYEYDDFSKFKALFDCGTVDVATLSLQEALEIYRQNPDFICLLSINYEGEDGYGVTVANTAFARTYPSALKLFMEEMMYSAKDFTCITGEEMRSTVEGYLTVQGEELPGNEFYYPLPELPEEEVVDAGEPAEPEETETND